MDWLLAVVRVVGVSFPGAASLVQLQAEIDRAGTQDLSERVRTLEDPISALHPEVPSLARAVYSCLRDEEEAHVWLDAALYEQYRKPLALLEAGGFIKGLHSIGHRYHDGVRVIDPSFTMYMCALCEEEHKMKALIGRVESCERGQWLHGNMLKEELGLPMPVIQACFEVFETAGFGQCSREMGPPKYVGKL